MSKNSFVSFLVSAAFLTSCASKSENEHRDKGAGIGAAAGAVLGGIMGGHGGAGNTGKGAAIGAVIGGTIGGVAGARMDKQAKELEKVAETKRTDQGLVTKLKNDILFDTGKSDLKVQAQENLRQMAAIMKKYPENVLNVNGFTDSTGPMKVNEELSQRRAEVVKGALVANGMPSETISTQGFGPSDPIADNNTKEGRSKNRRVEIQVTVDESKIPKQKTAGSSK